MLRRVNATLFEAPAGARIEVVAESRDNNGVNDARFEYAGTILNREAILGLPGCSFTVEDTRQRLEAVVFFDDGADGTARYDLFEVENGVQGKLGKFTLKSDGSNQIDFSIEPVAVAVPEAARKRAARRRGAKRPRKAAVKRAAPKTRSAKTPARKAAKNKTSKRRRGDTRKRR